MALNIYSLCFLKEEIYQELEIMIRDKRIHPTSCCQNYVFLFGTVVPLITNRYRYPTSYLWNVAICSPDTHILPHSSMLGKWIFTPIFPVILWKCTLFQFKKNIFIIKTTKHEDIPQYVVNVPKNYNYHRNFLFPLMRPSRGRSASAIASLLQLSPCSISWS